MKDCIGIISINYIEGESGTYQSLEIRWGDPNSREIKLFASGDAEVDYVDANNHLVEVGCTEILFSSSVDSFLRHDNGYEWGEFEGIPVIRKVNTKNP